MASRKDYDDSQEALFDGSVDLLIRLNGIIYRLNKAKELEDARYWLTNLKNYYAEIYPLLSPEEVDDCAKLMKNSNMGISKLRNDESMTGDVYNALYEFELTLRKLQHKHSLYVRLTSHNDLGNVLLGGD